MLFDAVPAKDITGGPWYTDQEFDHEFIDGLYAFVLQLVQTKGMASIDHICERVRISGISKVFIYSYYDVGVNGTVYRSLSPPGRVVNRGDATGASDSNL